MRLMRLKLKEDDSSHFQLYSEWKMSLPGMPQTSLLMIAKMKMVDLQGFFLFLLFFVSSSSLISSFLQQQHQNFMDCQSRRSIQRQGCCGRCEWKRQCTGCKGQILEWKRDPVQGKTYLSFFLSFPFLFRCFMFAYWLL